MSLYIAGPMSGYNGFNYPAFFDAEAARAWWDASFVLRALAAEVTQ